MIDTIELQKQIRLFLLTKCDRVFKEEADDNAMFPYVVFSLGTGIPNEERMDFYLDIDVWDNKQDTTNLETLANNIIGDGNKLNATGLDHKTINAATFYLENRNVIKDPDARIKRRLLRFIIQTY